MSSAAIVTASQLPPSLLDLLSNSIIIDGVLPYLSLSAIFSLIRTSRALRELLVSTPRVFRYIDLTKCRGAHISADFFGRIDTGGFSWRAERMDEGLTEDEFYSGPLLGVLSNFRRIKVLQHIHTLVLDGLASVTVDFIHQVVTSPDYNVRLLSIRRCLNVNQSKLQQLLCHICRPSRPEGTPKLQGLYVFNSPPKMDTMEQFQDFHFNIDTMGITDVLGAQLGAQPNVDDHSLWQDQEPWYTPSGQVVSQGHAKRSSWEETLQTCKGIISFDAVLCTHMHADMAPVLHAASREYLATNKPGIAPLATIALGPAGCASCGRNPHDAPVWGQSSLHEFPLLWPPPYSGKLIDAVRPPPRPLDNGKQLPQRLIVSCTWCLANRHCDSCHRWWCADCYNPKLSRQLAIDLEQLAGAPVGFPPPAAAVSATTRDGSNENQRLKVFNGLCVENCLVGEWMAGAGGGGMWG
jgi:hypothetical protein